MEGWKQVYVTQKPYKLCMRYRSIKGVGPSSVITLSISHVLTRLILRLVQYFQCCVLKSGSA